MPDESQQVSACPACGYEHDPGDTCIQPYQRWDELVGAVKDVCWKATPMYLPDGEDVNYYMVPKGSLHRLVGIGQRFGSVALRNGERDAAVKATLDAGKPEDAELIATNQLLRAALRVAYDDMEAMYQAVASVPRRHVTVVEDSWEKGRVLLMPDQSNRAEVSGEESETIPTMKALAGDGSCPVCGAIDHEPCVTARGAIRANHTYRNVFVVEVEENDRFSEHWTRLSPMDRP